MPVVNMRQLARSTSRVIGTVVRTKRPAVVTKAGRPVAVVTALDTDDFEDWILASAPEFVRAMREGDADLAAGRTTSLEDYLEKAVRSL
jgi:prevent-host-death family protein